MASDICKHSDMTEPLLFSDHFLDTLGDEAIQTLKCAICLEYYNKPCVLQCGHTFCFNCLLEMAKHMRKKCGMRKPVFYLHINCPNCRMPVPVPMVLQRQLTFNFTIASFVESLNGISVPLKLDASTTTDPVEETKKETPTSYEYDVNKLNTIRDDLDNMFSKLVTTNNVIDDARVDIDLIRHTFNTDDKHTTEEMTKGRETKLINRLTTKNENATVAGGEVAVERITQPCVQAKRGKATNERPTVRNIRRDNSHTGVNMYSQDPAIMRIGTNQYRGRT